MKKLCIIIGFFLLATPARAQVDLHAHLDMKPGLGPLLSGSFDHAPETSVWNSLVKTKASSQSLLSVHAPKLIVMSLYGHPFLSHLFRFDLRKNVQEAIEAEYQNITQFVKSHPESWIIAKTPKEARIALKQKKRVILLSIEGAYGAFESESDYLKWIDERGVAIVTPFHLTEDHFGGSAFMFWKVAYFNAPISFLESILLTGGECLKTFCRSPMGLKPDGRALIQELLKRKVWIDLSHANDMEVGELLPEFRARKLPGLLTHSGIREVYPAERAASQGSVDYIAQNGGSIGLTASDDFLIVPIKSKSCFSGLVELKSEIQHLGAKIGFEKVTLGSDINAPLQGLSPLCTREEGVIQSELEQKGFYNYENFSELSTWLSPHSKWEEDALENFLKNWERVRGE